ncbi:hypothetical protein ACLOJK_001890 [Asimina triloba]
MEMTPNAMDEWCRMEGVMPALFVDGFARTVDGDEVGHAQIGLAKQAARYCHHPFETDEAAGDMDMTLRAGGHDLLLPAAAQIWVDGGAD